jgi:1-phosphofructokinase
MAQQTPGPRNPTGSGAPVSSAHPDGDTGPMTQSPRVAVFGPHPILTITIEARPNALSDDVHVHAGGQGVWVARMAGELGADPVLCGTIGGEVGVALHALLDDLPFERHLVRTAGVSGCYVIDRRQGERRPVATAWSPPPSRHELDDLFSTTLATALDSDVLVVANPLPGDALPAEFYTNLVADVRATGTPVLVDLSSPRLDAALHGGPDLVKLNDWELAEYVTGPVGRDYERSEAVDRLISAGARSVIVTLGAEPAFAVRADGAQFEVIPPRFEHGSSEGCGDSMMGGIAAAWAAGSDWLDCLTLGAAAGAANFLRHGLGTGLRTVVEQLEAEVKIRPL